jgi:3-hydroxybutyryl-CoA dehydrogenase
VRAGFITTLEDVLPGNLRRAEALLAPDTARFAPRYATSIEEAVRDADLVIDTVPDELESKLEILSLLDRMAPPAALFATPIHALSIADLASCTYRPTQCFGLQMLEPRQPAESRPDSLDASLKLQLSYVPGCSPQVLAAMRQFLQQIGAEVTAVEDGRPLP